MRHHDECAHTLQGAAVTASAAHAVTALGVRWRTFCQNFVYRFRARPLNLLLCFRRASHIAHRSRRLVFFRAETGDTFWLRPCAIAGSVSVFACGPPRNEPPKLSCACPPPGSPRGLRPLSPGSETRPRSKTAQSLGDPSSSSASGIPCLPPHLHRRTSAAGYRPRIPSNIAHVAVPDA